MLGFEINSQEPSLFSLNIKVHSIVYIPARLDSGMIHKSRVRVRLLSLPNIKSGFRGRFWIELIST